MTPAASSARAARDDFFRVLYDEHASYVAHTLGRLGIPRQDRDDLAAEVFVRVHGELERFDRARPVRPWLFAFAARVAANHRRLARHRREKLGEEHEASSDAPQEAALMAQQTSTVVDRALEALDDDKRAVFVLHELDEVSIPEIACALEIPEGTAWSRLRAARAEFGKAARRIVGERSDR